MNYFELFEIPAQLKVDAASLSKKFFQLSRKYHPDYHAQSGGEMQVEALERSAMLNKAWKTFQDPDATIKYVLQWKGLMQEEEKYDLPTDFLMEVLELNEQLMEIEGESTDGSRQMAVRIQAEVTRLEKEIYEPVKEIVEHYQEGVTSEKELLQVKAYYYKKKYLDRIRRQLGGKA